MNKYTVITGIVGITALGVLGNDCYKAYRKTQLRSEIRENIETITHSSHEEARKARQKLEEQMKELGQYE